jgi:hypothetical protein|tara:strand:- start:133 stop:333 length:201 start_codon:yes stop_codon:yes gene_type:complete
MSIEEYRKKVDEAGCGCRQCNPPVKVGTRHSHLLSTAKTGSQYWRRKKEIEEYNEMVERVLRRVSE